MMTQTTQQAVIYEVIGGAPTIARLVDRFYDLMDNLPEARELRAIHAPDLTETKRVLRLYLAQWMGGPGDYSAERGHPRLKSRHMGFPVGIAERDSWLHCMRLALEDTVSSTPARDAIMQALTPLADWMRNRPEG
ncbi:group II truncated hemoglobin [Niveispirillum irakense]|uniref:group II truncated hemoglobin n=1 Tax=Niveispirillum irakense TaxID=34011 RepID=UPI0003F73C90|nr:group II truncated hemoglobin [Niveispirillum irakense]